MTRGGRALADMIRNTSPVEQTRLALSDVFEEEPVPLDVFVRDEQFLANPPLGEIQYAFVRHMEQIYLPTHYADLVENFGPYWKPERFINFAYVQWGKGAGKDHVCRVAHARAVYLLLCLKSPQKYFEMPRQDSIHTLNVASTATQALRAYFKPLGRAIKLSPWFVDKFDALDTSIRFDKNIEAVSGHSMAESMEGLNIIMGIADEISAFRTKEEADRMAKTSGREATRTAESVLKLIRTSARTRFPDNFKMAAISYPRFRNDPIQQLTALGVADNEKRGADSKIYVSGPLPTWEVNPRVKSKESFREDYDEDPEMAKAMYECDPPLGVNRYFRNDQAIFGAFMDTAPEDPDPVQIEYYWGLPDVSSDPFAAAEFGEQLEAQEGWQVRFKFADNFHPYHGALYCLHGDMAITGDRAGIAMAHVRDEQISEWGRADGEGTVSESKPIVKVDFVTSFGADKAGQPFAREVQIRWYRQLIVELVRRGFTIVSVTFDRFQSEDTMQLLRSRGIESTRFSLDTTTAGYESLRDVIYDYRLEAPYRYHTITEIMSLQRLGNGKVDHPPGGSKDEADALAGAVFHALAEGGGEGEDPERADIKGASISFESLAPPDLFSDGFDMDMDEGALWDAPPEDGW